MQTLSEASICPVYRGSDSTVRVHCRTFGQLQQYFLDVPCHDGVVADPLVQRLGKNLLSIIRGSGIFSVLIHVSAEEAYVRVDGSGSGFFPGCVIFVVWPQAEGQLRYFFTFIGPDSTARGSCSIGTAARTYL
jgi:hypothetical protein